MPVEYKDFLKHSRRVRSKFDDEIARRCSISRGYYCAFHYILDRWRDHPQSHFGRIGVNDHKEAHTFLATIGEKDLADDLDDIHEKRKKADYKIDETVDDLELGLFHKLLGSFLARAKQV